MCSLSAGNLGRNPDSGVPYNHVPFSPGQVNVLKKTTGVK